MSKRTSTRKPRSVEKALAVSRMAIDIPPATATVLSKRLPMLAAGAVDPKRRNHREEHRMVAEKLAAGIEASTAAGQALVEGGMAVARRWWQAMGALTSATLVAPKRRRGGRSPAGAVRTLVETTLAAAVASSAAALRPAHRRVTANARRLGKAKPGR